MTYARSTLALEQFCPRAEAFHLARGNYDFGDTMQLHSHDFAEVFWVTHGRGTHLINGQRQEIVKGDMLMIRPADEHGFVARAGQGFTIINLAFAPSVLEELRSRYAPPEGLWPWHDEPMPYRLTVDHATLTLMNQEADRLARSPTTRLYLDGFLLRMVAMTSDQHAHMISPRPTWLTEALVQMDDPEALRGGAGALAELCHRSIEHVNRVVKQHMNCTTSKLINELRIDRAARLLRMSDIPILQVAAESGYDNLGYFYRCFKQRFGQTPRRYRVNAQSVAR